MNVTLKPLAKQVIVITGASSGIGQGKRGPGHLHGLRRRQGRRGRPGHRHRDTASKRPMVTAAAIGATALLSGAVFGRRPTRPAAGPG